jgi:hypothetical protein
MALLKGLARKSSLEFNRVNSNFTFIYFTIISGFKTVIFSPQVTKLKRLASKPENHNKTETRKSFDFELVYFITDLLISHHSFYINAF